MEGVRPPDPSQSTPSHTHPYSGQQQPSEQHSTLIATKKQLHKKTLRSHDLAWSITMAKYMFCMLIVSVVIILLPW